MCGFYYVHFPFLHKSFETGTQGQTCWSGHLGEFLKGWLHEVGKTLNSEYGELRNRYMKELTSKF